MPVTPQHSTTTNRIRETLVKVIIPYASDSGSGSHTETIGAPVSMGKSSKFNVLYARASAKKRKSWLEGTLVVSEEKSQLFDNDTRGYVGGATTHAGNITNSLYHMMAQRSPPVFVAGDEMTLGTQWSIQIVSVMHGHLVPYDGATTPTTANDSKRGAGACCSSASSSEMRGRHCLLLPTGNTHHGGSSSSSSLSFVAPPHHSSHHIHTAVRAHFCRSRSESLALLREAYGHFLFSVEGQ